jgi:hypothetical protein
MAQIGETPKLPSDWSKVELYGGPADGDYYALPTAVLLLTGQIALQRPCTAMFAAKVQGNILNPERLLCEHLYIRHNPTSSRFIFHSTSLI